MCRAKYSSVKLWFWFLRKLRKLYPNLTGVEKTGLFLCGTTIIFLVPTGYVQIAGSIGEL
jgi:hypothetical protein